MKRSVLVLVIGLGLALALILAFAIYARLTLGTLTGGAV